MKKLDNEVEINASAERVWHLLTDFASFPLGQGVGEVGMKTGEPDVVHLVFEFGNPGHCLPVSVSDESNSISASGSTGSAR